MPGPTEQKSLSDVGLCRLQVDQVDPTQRKLVAVINSDGDQAGHNKYKASESSATIGDGFRKSRPVL